MRRLLYAIWPLLRDSLKAAAVMTAAGLWSYYFPRIFCITAAIALVGGLSTLLYWDDVRSRWRFYRK